MLIAHSLVPGSFWS